MSFEHAFVARSYELRPSDLELYGHRAIFELSGAQKWINNNRLQKYGQLDMEATAQSLGVQLNLDLIDTASGRALGIPGSLSPEAELEIKIRNDLSVDETLLTFGHELGHIFLAKVLNYQHSQYSRAEENFCELFGREMVLPRLGLKDDREINEDTILNIVRICSVSLNTALLQLVEVDRLPPKFIVRSTVPRGENKRWRSRHAGQLVEVTFCFDCHEKDYKSCSVESTIATMPTFDFSHLEVAHSLLVCGNEEEWLRPVVDGILAGTPRQLELGRDWGEL